MFRDPLVHRTRQPGDRHLSASIPPRPRSSTTSACPHWCGIPHADGEPAHEVTVAIIPVMARRTEMEGSEIVSWSESADFQLSLHRSADGITWLFLGDGPRRSIEVSHESARALLRALTNAVALLTE